MPLLIWPVLALAGVSVTGLVGKVFLDEVDETARNITPSIATLGALALAGAAVYVVVKSK